MSKERIETGPAPAISVTCHGDLVISGWAEQAIGIRGAYTVDDRGKTWVISSDEDLVLQVPMDSALHIAEVVGDLVIKYSQGDAAIDTVHGDAVLRGLGIAKVGVVHGDLSLKHFTGLAHVEKVHGDVSAAHMQELAVGDASGDLSLRHINGSLQIDRAEGDIDLRLVAGAVSVGVALRDANLSVVSGVVNLPDVKGDIRLKGGLQQGNHVLTAERDIVVRWPNGMPMNLIATAPAVTSRATLDEFEQKGDAWIGRIGDSKTNVELTAGRQIQLKDAEAFDSRWGESEGSDADFGFDFDFTTIGERISAQINEKMAVFTRNMEQQFGPDFGREIGEKMARKAEQAAQRAEKAAERAAQRAEKAAERAQKQETRHNPWQDFSASAPSAGPAASKPASPEEQLKILRMVEKGMISPEEASMLLEALEA